METSERAVLSEELRWALIAAGLVALILIAIIYAALALHVNPPSNIELMDPKTLHLTGEFTETNLGTQVAPDGRITARFVTTQFEFVPQCAVLPVNKPVILRFASPDVIHGLLISGTNVNTMVVPGYVSQVHTVFRRTGDLLMPCHEYCGLGHSQMWTTVRIVPEQDFKPDKDGRVSCASQR